MELFDYLLAKKKGGEVPTPNLQSKEVSITENGTTTVIADEGYDGLSQVEIETNVQGGADLSEYFDEENSYGGTISNVGYWAKYIKKIPYIYITSTPSLYAYFMGTEIDTTGITNYLNQTSALNRTLNYTFNHCEKIKKINLSGINVSIYNANNAFNSCYLIEEIDLSNLLLEESSSITNMFYACRSLQKLDVRSMEFTKASQYGEAFGNFSGASYHVPNNCLIIVKDQTQKDWINTNFPSLANVQTVEEYNQ